jgi:hypothetical protein
MFLWLALEVVVLSFKALIAETVTITGMVFSHISKNSVKGFNFCLCLWVVDGGDGLQIWRVAVNILNKQSQTANNVWSSILGVGQGAHCRKAAC